jgi:hypothetical protein
METWKMVSEIKFGVKTVHRIVVLLSYFSEGVAEFQGGNEKWTSEVARLETMSTKFGDIEWYQNIDFGDVTFKGALDNELNQLPKKVTDNKDKDAVYMSKLILGLQKQLGHRVYRALPRFLQAWRFLEHCLNPSVTLNMMVDNVDVGIELPLDFIASKVKYVGVHRMKVFVGEEIMRNLTSVDQVFDYFAEKVVPNRQEKWDNALDLAYHVYGKHEAVNDIIDGDKIKEALEEFDELVVNEDTSVPNSGLFNGDDSSYKDELKGHSEGTHEMRTVRQILENYLKRLLP